MATATDTFAGWLQQADIVLERLSPSQQALLEAVFRFRQRQGADYFSTRLLSHFLLHCDCGLKVASIARLLGISRPTASGHQGISCKQLIQAAHHRLDGRPYGKLLPRYAGPIAQFLLTHPDATRADLIDFVEQTFGVRVSRIALYKFLKKYGLNNVSAADQSPVPGNPVVDSSPAPPVESPRATPPAPTMAPTPAVLPVGLLAATLIATPTPVIELANSTAPSQPSPPPFSSGERNLPVPSC
jgi:hypothetical protein